VSTLEPQRDRGQLRSSGVTDDDGYERIEAWHRGLRGAVTDALTYLAGLDESPVSDGILGDWIDTLVAMRFSADDVPLIVRMIDKPDPHLQEAGLRLARSAVGTFGETDELEAALARVVSRDIDGWVLEALVDLLATTRLELTAVYQKLAAVHGASSAHEGLSSGPTRRRWIMRNRYIQPWRRLVELYEQNAIQTPEPRERDLAYLPVLERELGTRGWRATQRHILTRMGFDPDEHLRLLRGRP
jgi:hypothetical protein